jgi:hypothetical protein
MSTTGEGASARSIATAGSGTGAEPASSIEVSSIPFGDFHGVASAVCARHLSSILAIFVNSVIKTTISVLAFRARVLKFNGGWRE